MIPVGRDGPRPAQDLRRRQVVHGAVMVRPVPRSRSSSSPSLDHAATVATPATDDLVDVAGEDCLLFDLELAPDRVVVERLRRL